MATVEKVLIFGSTGRIGSCLLKRLVTEFQVSVFVRTPSKVPEDMKDKVNIIQGDLTNTEQVDKALEGHHAVIYSVGPPQYLAVRFQTGTFRHMLFKGFTVVGDLGKQMEILRAAKDVSWVAIATPWVKYADTVHPSYMVELNKDPGVDSITTGEMADFMVKILKNEEEYQKYHQGLVGMSTKPKSKWF